MLEEGLKALSCWGITSTSVTRGHVALSRTYAVRSCVQFNAATQLLGFSQAISDPKFTTVDHSTQKDSC